MYVIHKQYNVMYYKYILKRESYNIMSSDSKIVGKSIRIAEDDIIKFREYAEEKGLSQAEMFEAMMNAFEMSKAKALITDRAKEVEVFQDTVNNLVNMYINSLIINQSSEERIRETLSLELNTKDKTIKDLQEYKESTKEEVKTLSKELKEAKALTNKLSQSLDNANKELLEKSNIITSLQEQIGTLNAIVTEYKSFKDINKDLELKINELNIQLTDSLQTNTNLHSNNKDLNSKLENEEKMKEFYKTEVESLKEQITALNTNLKDIEKTNKNEIKALTKDHKEELKKLEATLKARFETDLNNRLELENTKYKLELDKYIAKVDTLTEKEARLKADINTFAEKEARLKMDNNALIEREAKIKAEYSKLKEENNKLKGNK